VGQEPRVYRPFAALALAATLAGGSPLGIWLLAWLYLGAAAVPAEWLLLHAHLQLFGFFGTLMMGVAQHLLPRFTGRPSGSPDTVDFNGMKAVLGAVHKRNPRVELVHRYPLLAPVKLVTSVGFERPFFGNDVIGTDLGPGDLSGYPAVSGGIGLEVGRIGSDLGIGASQFYVRTTYGGISGGERATTWTRPLEVHGEDHALRGADARRPRGRRPESGARSRSVPASGAPRGSRHYEFPERRGDLVDLDGRGSMPGS
jgi:hypothetical protein